MKLYRINFLLSHQFFKMKMQFRGEWPCGLRRCNENWKVPSSNPLDARPGLGTQPRYEAPGDLRVEYVQNAVINIGLVRLSP